MEEYDYKIFVNDDGDPQILKDFYASLKTNEKDFFFGARLSGDVLTLEWAGKVPYRFSDQKVVTLSDGKAVTLENITLQGLHLPPSLREALRYLVSLKDSKVSYTGTPPENLGEKMERLDGVFIEVEHKIAIESLHEGDRSQLKGEFARIPTTFVVLPPAYDYLQRESDSM